MVPPRIEKSLVKTLVALRIDNAFADHTTLGRTAEFPFVAYGNRGIAERLDMPFHEVVQRVDGF